MSKPPNYSVSVKRPGSTKWEVFENVCGDTTYMAPAKETTVRHVPSDDEDAKDGLKAVPVQTIETETLMSIKVLFLENNERIEIGLGAGVIIKYSVERYYHIKEQMSNEAGQEVRTKQ